MANARRSHDKKLDRFFINLDDTQCGALHSILDGNSVFITGSAGTGKSFLLNRAISMMKSLNQHVHITGSTGVAACNIGGTTLHSFAGIRLGTATLEKCITMVTSKARSVKKYTKCDKLIIDEQARPIERRWIGSAPSIRPKTLRRSPARRGWPR